MTRRWPVLRRARAGTLGAGDGAPAGAAPPVEVRVDAGADPALADVTRLADRLAGARRVLVLTGAGTSVASGIPAYRTPEGDAGGAVSPYAAADLPAELDGTRLPGSLPLLWQRWGPRRAEVTAAQPNPAHLALAAWLAATPAGTERSLVTQNVDDLHERAAGSDVVVVPGGAGGPTEVPVAHLHGQLLVSRCVRDPGCHRAVDREPWTAPPPCPGCGGLLRPDVVLFGEPVALDAQWQARRAVRGCDVLLAVGTSGLVSSASSLLRHARDVGALTVSVNPDAAAPDGLPLHGSSSSRYDVHVRGAAEDVLPLLLTG